MGCPAEMPCYTYQLDVSVKTIAINVFSYVIFVNPLHTLPCLVSIPCANSLFEFPFGITWDIAILRFLELFFLQLRFLEILLYYGLFMSKCIRSDLGVASLTFLKDCLRR